MNSSSRTRMRGKPSAKAPRHLRRNKIGPIRFLFAQIEQNHEMRFSFFLALIFAFLLTTFLLGSRLETPAEVSRSPLINTPEQTQEELLILRWFKPTEESLLGLFESRTRLSLLTTSDTCQKRCRWTNDRSQISKAHGVCII